MYTTIEMACAINGFIADENGKEDFLSNRNYQIMIEFLKNYDCLVWGNTTFENVKSWGQKYIDDLRFTKLVIFSRTKKENFDNVFYVSSIDEFKSLCKKLNLNNVFVSGGATINSMFLENNLVDDIIINYNPYLLTNGINLFKSSNVEKKLKLKYIKKESEDIVQICYDIVK